MIQAQLADGRVLEFPDGTDPAVIQRAVQKMIGGAQQQPKNAFEAALAQTGGPQVNPDIMAVGSGDDRMRGVGEAGVSMLTGAVAEPVAGVAGLASLPFQGAEGAAQTVEGVRESMTFQPSQAGQETLQQVGEFVAPVVEPVTSAIDAAADWVLDVTGSPAAATVVKTAPAAIAEFVGLRGLQSLRTGTRLLDDAGRPTRALDRILDKQGLVYDNLTPEAKQAIPEFATPKALPSPKSERGAAGELALIEQIKSGGRDDALAGLKVTGNRLEVDKFGQEAVKQGFDPGFVQAVKTANPETRAQMARMTDIMERITKNRSLAVQGLRPTNIVGESVLERVKFIRETANDARQRLNNIARNELPGARIDTRPIVDRLGGALDNLNIRVEFENGVPKPIYKGSQISKDRTSQRIINDLIDLMSEGGVPDAARFHSLKRQLDTMIDFRKKSAGGLTDAGKGVLKDIRAALNESLRAANPRYAEVNDILSQSLTALDDFNKASGPSIDIFGEGADKAVGTNLRSLMSNRQTRVNLDNALNQLDETASSLGGQFRTDYKDLSMFANGLEDRFGAVAQTSLKGEQESALRFAQQATTQGPRAAATEAAFGAARGAADKLRGVNDFNAFQSMKDLLKR